MLSIFSQKVCPRIALENIISATQGVEEKTVKKWQKIVAADNDCIYVILSGEIEFRRDSDNLCLFTLKQQGIFGLTAMFCNTQSVYGLVRTNAVVRVIKKNDFHRLLSEQQLWESLSHVLAWHLSLLSKRDEVLVGRSAYAIVREFLFEINDLMKLHQRDINIYEYIQEYTSLARSTIIKILADLKKGNYIDVNKGRLVCINSLPEKY